MRLLRFLILMTCVALSAIVAAQGGLGGSWSVTYFSHDGYTRYRTVDAQGNVADSGNVPWWTGPTEVAGGMTTGINGVHVPTNGIASAWSEGTVTVHFHWTDDNSPPPSVVWVRVSSGSTWSGNQNATGAVNNAFADPITSFNYGQDQSGTHVVRKICSRDFYMTYHVSSEVHGAVSGILGCGGAVSATTTDRAVDLNLVGYTTHYARALTGATITYNFPTSVAGWALDNPPASFQYAEATAVPAPYSNGDLYVLRNIDFGFDAPDWHPGEGGWQEPPPVQFDYQGAAIQEHVAPEAYKYTNRNGVSGETLPSGLLQNGWDIGPLQDMYLTPFYDTSSSPKEYVVRDGHLVEEIQFEYKWSDGCKGTAILNMTFHPPTDNYDPRRLAIYKNPKAPGTWLAYPFASGQEWSHTGWAEEDVVYTKAGINLKAYKPAYEILSGFVGVVLSLSNEAKFVASALGKTLDIPPQEAVLADLARGSFAEAEAGGRVTPSNWREILACPTGGPDLGLFKWKGEYAPDYNVSYYVGDTWDSTGYTGQGIYDFHWYSDMMAADRQFWFDLDLGLTGGH